ncbi:MAG: methyltransferase domain-containing protein [Kiloniellales bacterium]
MGGGLQYDEKASRRVEAIYSTPDVVATRNAVLETLALRRGEQVLDIGSGPGYLAYDMARSVGPEGRVLGIDVSPDMLELSRRRCEGCANVDFKETEGAKLAIADASFDAAVSIQVYEYIPEVADSVAELYRVLRPGGRAVIMATDWDSLICHSSDPERHFRVLAAWEEHVAHRCLPRILGPMLEEAGFRILRRQLVPIFNPEYHENTYSHGIIELIAAFVPGRNGVTKKAAQAWANDLRRLGAAGRYFFSLNRYLFTAGKPDG